MDVISKYVTRDILQVQIVPSKILYKLNISYKCYIQFIESLISCNLFVLFDFLFMFLFAVMYKN